MVIGMLLLGTNNVKGPKFKTAYVDKSITLHVHFYVCCIIGFYLSMCPVNMYS